MLREIFNNFYKNIYVFFSRDIYLSFISNEQWFILILF